MNPYWSRKAASIMPYVPGEQPKDGVLIKLNTNENPYPPSPHVTEAIQKEIAHLHLYPSPNSDALRETIARRAGLSPDWVFVGNGSDEVLALAFQAYFDHDTPISSFSITYSFYPVYAQLYDIPYQPIAYAPNESLDLAAFSANHHVVIPNPHAPTGRALPLEAIERLLVRLQANGRLLLLDEAYVEFGAENAIALLSRFDNLLIVRTLSKSHSLAGLRVGYALGQPALLEALYRIKDSFNSYPLDRLAQVGAIAALEDEAYFQNSRDRMIEARNWFSKELHQLQFEVPPSLANFIFCRHPRLSGKTIQDALRERGILVRRFNAPDIADYNRITIGTYEQMQKTIQALRTIVSASME